MNTPNKRKRPNFMLDTVAIKLKYPDFKVLKPDSFYPAFRIQNRILNISDYGSRLYAKFEQNPSAQDKKIGIYKPRLTGYERIRDGKFVYELHIELSIPKLLFGNSLQELENDDFDTAISVLKARLQNMSVETSESILKQAVVVKAHFSKNIPLPRPFTAQDAISGLYKADLGRRKDINIRHYGNDGQSLYFYASSANIIFYDKLRDIETPKSKAVDKDKLKQEKYLLRESKDEEPQEILRFEIRLAKQISVNAFLSRALDENIKDITFERIFDKTLCQKVLLKGWEEIINTPASQLALKMEKSPEEIFDAMIKDLNPAKKQNAHSLNQTLARFGLYTLVNRCGARKIRNKIEKNWSKKSWTRLSKKIKESVATLKEIPTLHIISETQSALNKFEKYDWRPK